MFTRSWNWLDRTGPSCISSEPSGRRSRLRLSEEELERLAAEIERDGVAVQTYACPQAASSAILSVATHQEADLIVVGSKGMHGARRVLGSVPNSIAHQASCAVMIVPTG